MAAYTPSGRFVGQTAFPSDVDQCSLDQRSHVLACAGNGELSILRSRSNAPPALLATTRVGGGAHTVGIDTSDTIWTVTTEPDRDDVRRFAMKGSM